MLLARGRHVGALVGALALLLVATPAFAQLYKWTDDQGQTHVTQGPESVPPQYRDQATIVGDAEPKAERVVLPRAPASPATLAAQERARRAAALKEEREERARDYLRELDQRRLYARVTQDYLAVARQYLARGERVKAQEAADRAAEVASGRSDWLAVGAFYRTLRQPAKADQARARALAVGR